MLGTQGPLGSFLEDSTRLFHKMSELFGKQGPTRKETHCLQMW